ncbi:hypothetical protein [Streptomyces sp. NPDC101150]|uniref:hypothetical protein n=1 Tax=Streptomyces sp. NPDC101150 TaxID=3366114 RepID=UPI0038085627
MTVQLPLHRPKGTPRREAGCCGRCYGHRLRHTRRRGIETKKLHYAALLTATGTPPRVLMEILGHSQISMTMDVHTHVAQDTQREAISHIARL